MDEFDARILNLIQDNSRLTAEKLSSLIGLSPAACQKRLKKLRRDGVIAKEVAVLSPEAVGRKLTMIVDVTMEREHPDVLDRFKRTMLATPEVMQCYYVTGDADFIVILTVSDMKEYEEFTRRFFFQNSNIQRFQTNVVMDAVKTGMRVPVAPAT